MPQPRLRWLWRPFSQLPGPLHLYFENLEESKPTGWTWVCFMLSWLTGLWVVKLIFHQHYTCLKGPMQFCIFLKMEFPLFCKLNPGAGGFEGVWLRWEASLWQRETSLPESDRTVSSEHPSVADRKASSIEHPPEADRAVPSKEDTFIVSQDNLQQRVLYRSWEWSLHSRVPSRGQLDSRHSRACQHGQTGWLTPIFFVKL